MRPIRLVPNWRRCYRMFSVQAMTLAGAIQATWALIPEDLKATLPPTLVHWVSLALLLAGIVGRLIDQPKAKP